MEPAKSAQSPAVKRARPRAVKSSGSMLGGASGVLAGSTKAKLARILQLTGVTALLAGGIFAAY